MRALVQETRLAPVQLIQPFFVCAGDDVEKPIAAMPGQSQWSVDRVTAAVDKAWAAGIRWIILFGIPEAKDAQGTGAYHAQGIVQAAIRTLRKALPDLGIIGDVCLCEFTDHGHCGMLQGQDVDNDATCELLGRTAVSLAEAGADMVAPSAMMDGQVKAIRGALDAAGFQAVPIMSYAAKYASAFYGPFREAAESAPAFGDRRAYQMQSPNSREAMREIALDIAEGADLVMVKPALAYLDVVRAARDRFDVPVVAYNVSGEYAMVKAAAKAGYIDEAGIVKETLLSMRRAGADAIITYFAMDYADQVLSW